jgi:hypothetical protein
MNIVSAPRIFMPLSCDVASTSVSRFCQIRITLCPALSMAFSENR